MTRIVGPGKGCSWCRCSYTLHTWSIQHLRGTVLSASHGALGFAQHGAVGGFVMGSATWGWAAMQQQGNAIHCSLKQH